MKVFARKSLVAAAAVALTAGVLCSQQSKADDTKMDGKMSMTAEDQAAMTMQMDQMKKMAADSSDAKKMTTDMAKMMVMDKMAEKMSMDPQFKQGMMDAMNDPNIKKVHEDAMTMAKDPEQMKQLKTEIMADGQAMKMITHHAAMMNMMKDKMGMGGKMMDKMEDKMNDKMGDQK